ncbi:orange carotenoid protein [Leptolyngbya sp. Heron Island J]|uniref:orange carotenoid protein N-terminal domain-containing protein n=1 Tax=Leptolyngbya sp. Heron Island J TaxID=1385935 RepID=UPI0003B9CBBF|nr:orange carotenoid protein N-terminal domain-containing protein [Leptolyngbya sp. Heron Island J]ESA32983.1 orange carotenoid protein [Leptolyngbya sp. Heron Island J]
MTFTTSNISQQSFGLAGSVPATLTLFNRLSTDDKLGVLWFIYKEMGNGAVTPAATGAARLQFATGLLGQVKDLSPNEQLAFMRDLVNRARTPMTRAYGVLTNNTKLAFWYQLAEMMKAGDVIGVPSVYKLSPRASEVYSGIVALEFGQQITLLRQSVISMGYDPFA